MKFSGSIEINKPIDVVVRIFADPSLLKEHQDGFLRKEFVRGEPGIDGTVAKMYYAQGKGEMELTETVVANNLPHSFEAFYHHKHMDNTMRYGKPLNDQRTLYSYEGEYVRMSLLPKIVSIIFPTTFKKPALKWMRNFRDFVEQFDG